MKRRCSGLPITAMCLLLFGCGDFVTPPAFTVLDVQVRTPEAEPVQGARIEVLVPGDSVPFSQPTGITGRLTLIGTPPGVYRVGIQIPPTGYEIPSTQETPLFVEVVQDEKTTVHFTLVRK